MKLFFVSLALISCASAKPPASPLADILARCREEGVAAYHKAPDGQKDAAAEHAYEACKARNGAEL